MSQDDDEIEQFRKDLQASLARNREAFEGKYGDALKELLGLSADDLAAIVPDVAKADDYAALISVVKEASRRNIIETELFDQIKALGNTAVSIAKTIAGLAAVFE